MIYFWIAVGSALGGMGRYALSGFSNLVLGETFPWGTLIVNVTGCFVIGLFATVTGPDGRLIINPNFRQFFMIGICGGYTTFSSFSLQTLNLAHEGDIALASANIALSVILCLLAVWFGDIAGQFLNNGTGG